jgi:acyl dehydratase
MTAARQEEGDAGARADQDAGPRVVEQRGLYFDELEEGVLYAHRPGRTVTEADNVLFTTLTMNTQALHLDAAWSAGQPFGQRLVNSMFTLATMVGQSVGQLTQGTIIAQLGLTDVSFPHPLHHGDTLYTETLITGKRLSGSRPGQGIVTMRHTGRNQDGTVVALATRSCLMWTREAHARQRAGQGNGGEEKEDVGQGSGHRDGQETMPV